MTDVSTYSDQDLLALVGGKKPLPNWSDEELQKVLSTQKPLSAGDKVEDVAKSAGVGLANAGIGLAGAPGDIQAIAGKAAQSIAGKELPPTPQGQSLQLPGSQQIKSKVEEWTGPFYQPKSSEGRVARTLAEFSPGAAFPGSAVQRIGQVVGPAFGSELAGKLAGENNPQEQYWKAAGAMGGAMLPTALGRLATPLPITAERQAAVDTLRGEGVMPTAGQATGRKALRYSESALGDLPGAGGQATDRSMQTGEQFTAAVLRRVGENATRATPEVIDRAFTRIGNQFDTVSQRNTLAVDPQFGHDLAQVQRDYNFLANPMQRQVLNDAVNDVIGVIQQNNGTIPGAQYQAMRSRLGQAARSTQRTDNQLSDAFYGLQNSLDDAMERSIAQNGNPADIATWREARQQYRNLLPIERAATGAGEDTAAGILSPRQMRQAVVSQGQRNYARGQGDFADLVHAGNEVMTPLPQSGTGPRVAAIAIPGMMGGAVAHALGGGGGEIAAGTTLGTMAGTMTPAALGRALMSRPAQAWLANQQFAPILNELNSGRGAVIQALLAEPRLQIESQRSQ